MSSEWTTVYWAYRFKLHFSKSTYSSSSGFSFSWTYCIYGSQIIWRYVISVGVWCILCAYYVTDMLFKFTIMNLISIDLSLDFRGLSWKCTCMNHVSCNFHATHPHTIYVIHSISICDHCLGLVTLNVTKIPLVCCWFDDGRDWWECLRMIESSWAHKVIIHNI